MFSATPANTGSVNGVVAANALPAGAKQCPVTRPFSKYGANTNIVEECCKCQQQTKCEAAADNVNSFNEGGVYAMRQNNDVVDKSKFFYRESIKIASR